MVSENVSVNGNYFDDAWLEQSLRHGSYGRLRSSEISPLAKQSPIENRMIRTLIGNLIDRLSHPYVPLAAQTVALPKLSAEKSANPTDRVLIQIARGLLPESSGEISVGNYRASTSKFYMKLVAAMPKTFGEKIENEPEVLKDAIATALGAKTFGDLEQEQLSQDRAIQRKQLLQAQSKTREQLIQNLAPVFRHIDEEFAKRLAPAREEERVYVGDELEPFVARRKIMVWERMISVMRPVEVAFNRAIVSGALDEKAIFHLGRNTHQREEAMPGIKVWSAPAQAFLQAGLEVVRANLRTKPRNIELLKLESTLVTAEEGRKEAEKLKPPGYPSIYEAQTPVEAAIFSVHWVGGRPSGEQRPQHRPN